jgi:hypothetical protein
MVRTYIILQISALAIDPKHIAALDVKGLALDALGNHTGAILYYDKVLATDPRGI